jgi:hypothetical protein
MSILIFYCCLEAVSSGLRRPRASHNGMGNIFRKVTVRGARTVGKAEAPEME